MTMIPKNIKTKMVDWLFEKPLAISLSLAFNVALYMGIKVLWTKTEKLETQMFELQNSVIKENTKAFHEFNLKNK